MHNAAALQGKLSHPERAFMTADQRLILKLEQISDAVDDDRLLAAYHMLEEVLRDLDVPTKAVPESRPMLKARRPGSDVVPPLAAAG